MTIAGAMVLGQFFFLKAMKGTETTFIAPFFYSTLVFVMIWVRWTVPRLRVDQLMHMCWKVFIPIGLFNVFGVAIWTVLRG